METLQQKQYRYVVLVVCLVITCINYLDRSVVAYAIEPIKADLGLTNATFGLAISVFAFGTLTINGIAGVLVDRFSPRVIWPIAVVIWSVVMLGLGLAQTVGLFMVLRYLLGVGEGANFPALDRTLLNWVSSKRISTVMAYALIGVPLANLIGGPVLSHLIIYFHWRYTFMLLGAAGLMTVCLWVLAMIAYRFPKQPYKATVDSEREVIKIKQSRRVTWLLLKNPALLSVSWAFFAFGYVLFFAITWLPGYLEQVYRVSLKQVGWFLMLPWGLATVMILLGGLFSDYWMKKTNRSRSARIYFIVLCQIVSVCFFIPPLLVHSLDLALVCISGAIGFALMPNAAFYSACSDLTKRYAGTATGVMVSFFSLSGIASPAITGWLADWMGGFHAAIFVLIVVVLTSILGLLFYGHTDESPSDWMPQR